MAIDLLWLLKDPRTWQEGLSHEVMKRIPPIKQMPTSFQTPILVET